MQRLFLTVHDVTPKFMEECRQIFEELAKRNIKAFNILVTPNWHGKAPIERNTEFINLVKKQPGTIVLHGYEHKPRKKNAFYEALDLNKGPEFSGIEAAAIDRKLKLGLASLKKAFNIEPRGFVPPYWVYSKRHKKLLEKYFKYYADKRGIDYFEKKFPAVPIIYSGGKYFSTLLAYTSHLRTTFKKEGIIRFALHPDDITYGTFARALKDLDFLLKNGWQPSVYEELIGDFVPEQLL
ncbi:MAG: DUF2334 domain-containing protein [Candidatus Woesearchaeota archaeon]|nr:DUF2334 domain-containing protein [Candidatus Woesearchaeota archaeon]